LSAIRIYIEGGDSAHGKAALRRGFNELLGDVKRRARAKGWDWDVIACGGRNQTKEHFLQARQDHPGSHVLLLVDADGTVTQSAKSHLVASYADLASVPDDEIHLTVQIMETWFVADPVVLAAYYGKGFLVKALSKHADLEQVPKAQVKDVTSTMRQERHRRASAIRSGTPSISCNESIRPRSGRDAITAIASSAASGSCSRAIEAARALVPGTAPAARWTSPHRQGPGARGRGSAPSRR